MSTFFLCLFPGLMISCLVGLLYFCFHLECKLIRYRADNLRLIKLNTSLVETLEQMEAQQNFPDPDRSKNRPQHDYPVVQMNPPPPKSWMTGDIDSIIEDIKTTPLDKPIINVDSSDPGEIRPSSVVNPWKRYQKIDSTGKWVHSDFADGPWTPME